MSTSIEEQIENHETRARLLRIVAERFPDVKMEALWKDGPLKPVLTDRKHEGLATHVFARDGQLFAYFKVKDRGDETWVFVCPGFGYGADIGGVLSGLSLEARREIVARTLEG
jgi:hypothetical protein